MVERVEWITPFGAAGVEECFFTWRSGEAPIGTGQQTLVAATTNPDRLGPPRTDRFNSSYLRVSLKMGDPGGG